MTLHSPTKSERNSDNFFQTVWPCLKGEEIVNRPEIQWILQELKSLISTPERIYSTLYESTLFRWMEFCQAMPQDIDRPKPYSLLTTALETAVAALKVRRGMMLPRHSNSETIAEQEPLWTYTVFTASLWVKLPNLQTDRIIELYKNEQEKIGRWHPLAGNLYEPKIFYKILPEPHPIIIDSMAYLMGSLTRIIPAVAYRWLTQDKKVWSSWWEVVTHAISPHNELREIIQKILPQDKQNGITVDLSEMPNLEQSDNVQDNSEVNSQHEIIENISDVNEENKNLKEKSTSKETKYLSEMPLKLKASAVEENVLADFQEWVQHHCSAAGKLNGKKQFIRIPEGLLIRESSLNLFIKENSEHPSVDSILKLLIRYLEQKSQNVLIEYSFIQDSKEEVISGIILKKQYLCESLKNYPENQFIQNLKEE